MRFNVTGPYRAPHKGPFRRITFNYGTLGDYWNRQFRNSVMVYRRLARELGHVLTHNHPKKPRNKVQN